MDKNQISQNPDCKAGFSWKIIRFGRLGPQARGGLCEAVALRAASGRGSEAPGLLPGTVPPRSSFSQQCPKRLVYPMTSRPQTLQGQGICPTLNLYYMEPAPQGLCCLPHLPQPASPIHVAHSWEAPPRIPIPAAFCTGQGQQLCLQRARRSVC